MVLSADRSNVTPPNGKPTFHIAFCVDDNYCRAMGGSIASIVANNPGQHFTFHLLAISLSDDNRTRFLRLGEMAEVATQIHIVDQAQFVTFSSFLGHSHYSLSIFTRLLIPNMLQGIAERVLYLDADILCLGALDNLTDIDFGDNLAMVVMDASETKRKRVEALNLKHNEYFNSGVMLINIDPWVAAGVTNTAVNVLTNSSVELRFPDQDALNIALNGRVRYLNARYNTLYNLIHDLQLNSVVLGGLNGIGITNRLDIDENSSMRTLGGAVFAHFSGPVKPWAAWTGHEVATIFAEYLAQSPWGDLPLDVEPRNSKEMRMYSRFLFRQGKPLQSLVWFLRYMCKRRRK
jgi:lipopolysaccharide biosynthesis glycosyltransferase